MSGCAGKRGAQKGSSHEEGRCDGCVDLVRAEVLYHRWYSVIWKG